jgi:hypothetical protein
MLREKRVQIPDNGSPALVNGALVHEPTGIQIVNGTSYASLRFLADIFGFITQVNDRSRVLNISTITAPTSLRGPTALRLPGAA